MQVSRPTYASIAIRSAAGIPRRVTSKLLGRGMRAVAVALCGLLLALAAADGAAWAEQPASSVNEMSVDVDPVDPGGVPEGQRDETLGTSWDSDGDVATVVLGGSNGLAVLTAASKDGYAWREIAVLPVGAGEADLWISNSCVTSSGRYMVVVYGPRSITNSEAGFGFGGRAVIVDLSEGEIRELGTGYSIAYYNPGCGAGDTFTLTAHAPGVGGTLVASVDARSGDLLTKATIEQQATSAISASDGTIYAATSRGIVRVEDGTTKGSLIATRGVAYDLAIDEAGRLGYVTYGGSTASAHVTKLASFGNKQLSTLIATGPVTELGLRSSRSGGFLVVGEDVKLIVTDPTIKPIPEASPSSVISSTGHLVVDTIKPAGIAPASEPADASDLQAQIGATATQSNHELSFELGTYEPASSPSHSNKGDAPRAPFGLSRSEWALAAGDPHNPVESERYCSVPRNDPNNQAYQPKPRQVQWAVDRAVSGQLTETRPANWRNLGMSSYSPQGLFPRVNLNGGGSIPPQVVLGVLMQESNMWQASRFTSPGNTGNPLIGNFYGNGSNLWGIDFTEADCGYGVGQITDGMRLAGHEKQGETALPYSQQRAIALDYTANVAMTVRMLGQKWNQLQSLGITINNGSPSSIENWFAAVWAYNTGLQPSSAAYGNGTGCSPGPSCTTTAGTWGLGWLNNPINPEYPASRLDFLGNDNAADAATPQHWPYPEKVLGFAAWGLTLVETQWTDSGTRTYPTRTVASYTLAWWNTTWYRVSVKPPLETFCDPTTNGCSSGLSSPCTIANSFCYWHGNATWKSCGTGECGYGSERFAYPAYATEASSMSNPALHPDTVKSSFLPNCSAPPVTMLVVDDTTHEDARNAAECSPQARTGSFEFTFHQAAGNGSYPAKVDLHQQGGGFNGHFYFSHVRGSNEPQGRMTGTWSLDQTISNQWTRVWIHLPDYAAWTDGAAYTITYGPGQSQTRYLPQRRYANAWIPIGVFNVNGVPSVSLSNAGSYNAGYDDIAWDAVGFQVLSAKPADFVVALGDSFASGEGAGAYSPWSDHGGSSLTSGQAERNGCHQSGNSWISKTVLPGGSSSTIGARANLSSPSSSLDFHFLACSGAESEQLLPAITADPADEDSEIEDNQNVNAENERGEGQYGMVSQLDAGYLDQNTTLVTLSIGGNDMRFAKIIGSCFTLGGAEIPDYPAACADVILGGDTEGAYTESLTRLDEQLGISLDHVLYQITKRAPNAVVVLAGYPTLFETGSTCVGMAASNRPWLNEISGLLTVAMQDAANRANLTGHTVLFANPQPYFTGRNLCAGNSAMNSLVLSMTPGDLPQGLPGDYSTPVSQESAHPNSVGTTMYSDALEDALVGNYP